MGSPSGAVPLGVKRLVALSLFFAIALAPGAEAARRRTVARVAPLAIPGERIDVLAAEALSSGVPGVSVAVSRGETPLFARGYGFVDVAKTAPVTVETIFQIASLTKQFTAAAILALEEQGVLSVSDPVTRWLPELDFGSRTVTLHHLLTHTSGLRPGAELVVDAWAPLAQSDMIDLIEERGFAADPGTREEYNNAGYYLLGVVIERASGMSFASFLEQRFFVPLGLARTAYCGTGPAVPVPVGSAQLFGATVSIAPIDMSVAFAAGALCSNSADLAMWSEALSGGAAVSVDSYQRMITPAQLADGTTLGYGYGLGLGTIEGRFATSHAGTIVGFESYMVRVPEDDLTVVVLVNVVSSDGGWARNMAREIAREMIR